MASTDVCNEDVVNTVRMSGSFLISCPSLVRVIIDELFLEGKRNRGRNAHTWDVIHVAMVLGDGYFFHKIKLRVDKYISLCLL